MPSPSGAAAGTTAPTSGGLQFGRRAMLQVDTLLVQDLRVTFKIKKTGKVEPNCSEISIYNLSPASRGAMQAKGAHVLLSVGYKSAQFAQVFSGDARTIDHVKGGSHSPDWETKLRCGDGERAFQFAGYSRSFGPGAQLSVVLQDVVTSLVNSGFRLGAGNALIRAGQVTGTLPSGITLHGTASAALGKVAKAAGLHFSIQDGTIQLLAEGETLHRTATLISPDTGLIGSPDHGTPETKGAPAMLKVRCLLQPDIRPGSQVKVVSQNVNGYFKVREVEHVGDTHGQEWLSHIKATPLSTTN